MLQAWEDGRDASPGERGLILLRVAVPDLPEDGRAGMTVGRRDAALLGLLERLFGGTAGALADCPGCGEQLEMEVRLASIRAAPSAVSPERFVLSWADREIAYRLPNAADLAALGAAPPSDRVTTAARWLAERCLLPLAAADGETIDDEAATALEAAIESAVLENDPQAVVTLAFGCPACTRSWDARFDVVEFLWRRFDALVRDLLREVHLLASAYGWSEREILSLTPGRRRHYLELIGQ